MRALALASLFVFSACTGPGNNVTVSGKNLITFFPFDGTERSWTFESDAETQHRMVGVRSAEPELQNDGATEVWTVQYDLVCIDPDDTTCTDRHYRTIRISADAGDGVRIHSITVGDGAQLDFDPPALIGDADTLPDEEWVTETSAGTISATFTGSEACNIRWTDTWDECIVLEVDDGGANTGLAGTIWAVASYNMVAFDIGEDAGRWELSTATFE
ncbi:MAG: hypothetical protein EP330_09410 [Deltaproteobacteria bacterium]|nr:MAG: hypothetical protein EP330_09410 [Deltaproteobacteria bacterium]